MEGPAIIERVRFIRRKQDVLASTCKILRVRSCKFELCNEVKYPEPQETAVKTGMMEESEKGGVSIASSLNNPVDGSQLLKQAVPGAGEDQNPQLDILPGDSATTKAEKFERGGKVATGVNGHSGSGDYEQSPSKRLKLDIEPESAPIAAEPTTPDGRVKGVAPIKKEFLVDVSRTAQPTAHADDDEAEASGKAQPDNRSHGGRGGKKTDGGQNKARSFGSSRDEIQLCKSRDHQNEFDPVTCQYGERCKWEHDVRRYLKEGKRADLTTLEGQCPLWQAKGSCPAGWRCRFASSHSKEVEHEDGEKELVLLEDRKPETNGHGDEQEEPGVGVVNVVSIGDKIQLRKKKFPTPNSDAYLKYLEKYAEPIEGRKKQTSGPTATVDEDGIPIPSADAKHEHRAQYLESRLRPSEKRRLYYGPETPVLAPLTTQGNMPFRRLCVSLGAQVTWSEMAMGMPLLQGEKGEWALLKAHESETTPPSYEPQCVVAGYDNAKDLKFGAQIAANKPWLALRTTEVLTALCPSLRAIDLNSGCPIDLVCRTGAGSALLDQPAKLEKILRGMNVVSGEVPITVKIRMGTKDKAPTAEKLCQRLVLGGLDAQESGEGPAGVAAITLHGRSKQQRYTRSADWEYIAECANLIKKLKADKASTVDTNRELDARDLPRGTGADNLPYFIGNGDVLSHMDYNDHLASSRGLSTCMVARGALIKPWIFEEIASNQYLDKSASERLGYIEQFVRNGLEYWGSDEIGVGVTRRFLLEWLSFGCRYIPVGLLEYLPPRLGDRPPAFRGRSELEGLLCSGNFRDWIKISEMFLGPAHKDFHFQPKHKSNSYEIEAEG